MRLNIALPVLAVASGADALVARTAAPVVELGYASYEGVFNATSG